MDDLVSIVVPVYNAEAYLDPCVTSIVGQTHQNLQIILVDDGSTDASAKMCDAWAQRDDRIEVVHCSNAGAPAARNTGFSRVRGTWLWFIDADDRIDADAVEVLLGDAAYFSPDVVVMDVIPFDNRGDLPRSLLIDGHFPSRGMADGRAFLANVLNENIRCYSVQYFLNVQKVRDAFGGEPYNARYFLLEDLVFTLRLATSLDGVFFEDRVRYRYRQAQGSLLHSVSSDRAESGYMAIQEALNLEMPRGFDGKVAKLCLPMLLGLYTQAGFGRETRQLRKRFRALILEMRGATDANDLDKSVRIKCALVRVGLFVPLLRVKKGLFRAQE